MRSGKARKPVHLLTLQDLEEHPVWEYAADEEGIEDQDETTVRPVTRRGAVDPARGPAIVAAIFSLADGTQAQGFVTAAKGSNKDLGAAQPAIITSAGPVYFWCGSIEPKKKDIKENYAALGRRAKATFPIRFQARVKVKGFDLHGEIPGFMVLEDWQSGTVKILT